MRSKRPSLYQQALKEIRRLEKAARRVEKRGYTFDLPFRRTRTGKEKTRFTAKEVERLKSLRTKDLYKYATAFGYSGEEYRKKERQAAAVKGYRTKQEKADRYWKRELQRTYVSIDKTIIDNFLNRNNWRMLTDTSYNKLYSFIQSKIVLIGIDKVAQAIQNATNDGFVYEFQRGYNYQFSANMIMFESYFTSSEERELSEIAQEQEDDSFEYYNESDDFESIFR